ncbi:MAG: ATP-binding cassette domain-containing protein [Coriobacteriaceae bacterium]|nr:ATP-binding cassette domain-containing protein [Coriobacteriaceae bacterium]
MWVLKNLSVGYGSKALITGINLSFDIGDRFCIVGDNGSGKSTLYRTIAGHIPPLNGVMSNDLAASCSIVSDSVRPPSDCTVAELCGLLGEIGDSRIKTRAPGIFNFIKNNADCRVSHLSLGQRRLLEIGICLAAGRSILILDEAFSGLDYRSRELCLGVVNSLSDITVFNTSHNLEDIVDLNGLIVYIDPIEKKLFKYRGARDVRSLRRFMVRRAEMVAS